MDSFPIKWSSRLSQVSEIPPDITFKFSKVAYDSTGVNAHKMILALVSDIFKKMFYDVDTMDKSAKEIIIEDTSEPAFRIMIDAIYGIKPIKENLEGKTVHETFAVLNLVTKYNIPELMLAVKDYISKFPLEEDFVFEVAEDTMEYLTTFKDDSQNLLLTCLNVLKSKYKDFNSFLQVIAKNGNYMSTLHKLALLLNDLPRCANCKTDPCQNGNIITADQFRVGLKMTNSPIDYWDSGIIYWKGLVVEILSEDKVKVKRECSYVDDENEENFISGNKSFDITNDGFSCFLFDCFETK